MRHIIAIIIFATLLAGAGSCSPRREAADISRAEAILDSLPDSALAILDSIDPAGLGDDLRALHAILLLRAKEICDIDISDDSLMPGVIDYYERVGDRPPEVLARYHHAQAQYQRHDYARSIISATKAYDIAAADSLHFWCGMTSRLIADCYLETRNSAEELSYARRALHHFRASGRHLYARYALNDLACAQVSACDYDGAISTCRQVIDSALYHSDSRLYGNANYLLGMAYIGKNDYVEAIKSYQDIKENRDLDADEFVYLGIAYAFEGQTKEAESIADSIAHSGTEFRQDLVTWLRFAISRSKHDYLTAMNAAYTLDSMSNKTYERFITQNITGSLVSSYEADKQFQLLKEANIKTKATVTIIILIFAILTVCAVGWLIIRMHKRKISEISLAASRIEEDLRNARSCNKAIFSLKYDMLDRLCQLVFQSGTDEKSQDAISEAVISHLKEWRNMKKKKFAELTSMIDKAYDNLYSDFITDFPATNEDDLKIFIFSILGFSGSSIAWFLKNITVTSVYDRKKRLKNRIKTSGATNRERYLEYL